MLLIARIELHHLDERAQEETKGLFDNVHRAMAGLRYRRFLKVKGFQPRYVRLPDATYYRKGNYTDIQSENEMIREAITPIWRRFGSLVSASEATSICRFRSVAKEDYDAELAMIKRRTAKSIIRMLEAD